MKNITLECKHILCIYKKKEYCLLIACYLKKKQKLRVRMMCVCEWWSTHVCDDVHIYTMKLVWNDYILMHVKKVCAHQCAWKEAHQTLCAKTHAQRTESMQSGVYWCGLATHWCWAHKHKYKPVWSTQCHICLHLCIL